MIQEDMMRTEIFECKKYNDLAEGDIFVYCREKNYEHGIKIHDGKVVMLSGKNAFVPIDNLHVIGGYPVLGLRNQYFIAPNLSDNTQQEPTYGSLMLTEAGVYLCVEGDIRLRQTLYLSFQDFQIDRNFKPSYDEVIFVPKWSIKIDLETEAKTIIEIPIANDAEGADK